MSGEISEISSQDLYLRSRAPWLASIKYPFCYMHILDSKRIFPIFIFILLPSTASKDGANGGRDGVETADRGSAGW